MNSRDQFDYATALCELYTGRSWDGTISHLTEAIARQADANEILDAHATWLSDIKTRVEASGEEWNTASCRQQSRLDGDLTTAPEWLAEEFEHHTPDERMNR